MQLHCGRHRRNSIHTCNLFEVSMCLAGVNHVSYRVTSRGVSQLVDGVEGGRRAIAGGMEGNSKSA